VTSPASGVLGTLDRKVDPRHCALLVIDMQNDFLHEQGKARREGSRDLGPMMEMVPRQARVIEAARAAGVPVVFVLQTTLPDQASSSDVWIEARSRARYSGQDMCIDGSWGQEVISELKPAPADHFVKKYRYSGFVGTNLDLLLRSLERRTVVCVGTSTNVCVEATAWDAFHHEYYVVYAADACASWDMALHTSTLTTAANRYATVADVKDLISCWHDSGSATGTEPATS
jgi:nicotinamidase-related amidase